MGREWALNDGWFRSRVSVRGQTTGKSRRMGIRLGDASHHKVSKSGKLG